MAMDHFCTVYSADVASLAAPAFFEQGLKLVPPARREAALRMRRGEDQRLSLGVGLLLVQALRDRGLSPAAAIARDRMGKPFLPEHPGLFFNLSHAGTRALCVLSDLPCGCDVEEPGRGTPALARRFFAPDEQLLLARLPDGFDELFCFLWTRKESYLKATGEGLSRSLSSFSALFPPPEAHFRMGREAPGALSAICLLAGPEVTLPEPKRITLRPERMLS